MSRPWSSTYAASGPWAAPAALVAAMALLQVTACEESPGNAGADAEAGVLEDSALADRVAMPDSGPPDAGEPPVGVPHHFCDQPFFKLHIGGPQEEVAGMSLWDGLLAYSRGPKTWDPLDLYLLNLDTCLEYRLTIGSQATFPHLRDKTIMWSDNRDYRWEPENFYCKDIYRYKLDTWTEEQLTNHPLCENKPQTNGRYLVYERKVNQAGESPIEILLRDLQEGTEIQLVEPFAKAGYYDITERYVAWSGYTHFAESLGKDVFYYDLDTGLETHIPNSALYFCYDVFLWGEYLTYQCSEYWIQSWYHLFLHHIPTGEELHLDGAGRDTRIIGGAIHEHLVVWNTTSHMDAVSNVGTDVVIYDVQTGVYRRLTTGPSTLAARRIFYPWILFGRPMGSYVYEYYVANLEALEVVDATGHLIPGEGVIDPPE